MNELLNQGAIFSPCRAYRYSLWRIWSDVMPVVGFIGLNPSTADETVNDPTIRRCMRFAKDWGYGGLIMLNLFAFRSTDPKGLRTVDDPVGPENDGHLCTQSEMCAKMIAAWGIHGAYLDRGAQVQQMLSGNLWHLGLTKDGFPRHPLYLRADIEPMRFIESTV